MRKKWQCMMAGVLLLLLISQPSVEASDNKRYIIGFKEEIQQDVLKSLTDQKYEPLHQINAVIIELTRKEASLLRKDKRISYVEVDAPVWINSQTVDWGVEKIGAKTAWENGLTGKGIKIAILDTGISTSHSDLTIEKGKSFVSYTSSHDDDNGHGTHVAGIISARNNTTGIKGIAHDATIYAAKVLDQNGDGSTSEVIKAIDWSLEQKVDLINLSMSGDSSSSAFERSLEQAYNQGVLIVAAAGNYGNADGTGDTVDFPAAYESVIAVAAINQQQKRAPFSATGPAVEVAAPGVNIYSTFLKSSYANVSGTSMAAPHVTGHLALLKQAYPQASHNELRQMLQRQTIDLGTPGRDPKYGFGQINIPADLKVEKERPFPPTTVKVKHTSWIEDKAQVQINWLANKEGKPAVGYNLYKDGQFVTTLTTESYTDTVTEGTYTYTVTAKDEDELESNLSKGVTIIIHKNSMSETKDSFLDIKGDEWFASSIYDLVSRGIIQGYPDETMKPTETITRGEAAVMMTRALKASPATYKKAFIDVRHQSFAADYIQVMTDQKIFGGYEDKSFRPHAPIPRGEVAAILNRSYKFIPVKNMTFSDVPSNYFAYADIAKVAGANIAQGMPSGGFEPKSFVTRAQFAVFLTRALKYEEGMSEAS